MSPKPLLMVVLACFLGVSLSACAGGPTGSAAGKIARPAADRTRISTTTTTAAPATSTTQTTAAAPPTTAAPATTAPACGRNAASELASTGPATQVIVVEAPEYASTYATLTAWSRQGSCWIAVFGPWTARIGYNGFADHRSEGDGTTPTGAYGIGPTMYGIDPNPGVRYSYQQLVCGDWWDEDPSSPEYNTFQYVPCGQTPPFGGGSEALWQATATYQSFAVIDYNTAPVVPGAGSGIFLHVDDGNATDGCVSIPIGELDELLDWLSPSANPLIVMGPESEIGGF